jgi:hypothetical protein
VTAEILVIAAIRIAGSLPVLRWPLAGGILAVLVDLSDLLLRDVLDLGGVGDYQALDKWLDGDGQMGGGRAVCLPDGRLRPVRGDG